MHTVIKNKVVKAWQLGRNTHAEEKLKSEGKLICLPNGKYEVFSQESHGLHGEIANIGDYIKIDSHGFPYPNSQSFFEKHHEHLGGEDYLQKSPPLQAWFLEDPFNEVIKYLQEHKGLVIDKDSPNACFRAPLWGATLSASRESAIIIYSIAYDSEGNISNVDFNFVAQDEFEKNYNLIE